MEKVCVGWWREADAAPIDAQKLLAAIDVPVVRAATVHVEEAEHSALRYGAGADGRLLTALASLWVDSYHDLPPLPDADAAWLVSESVPQSYGDAFTWSEGTRSPGLSLVTLLDKPAGLDEPTFYHYWHELHRLTTAECHPFSSYVRNEVVRPLTAGGPAIRGVVAESVLDVDDILDPHRFYISGGDREQLRINQKRVFAEVSTFINMDTIQVAPMAEYVVRRVTATSP